MSKPYYAEAFAPGRPRVSRDRAERAASDCKAGLGEQWVDEAECLAASVTSEDGGADLGAPDVLHARSARESHRCNLWL
jgi:hypothetical protein